MGRAGLFTARSTVASTRRYAISVNPEVYMTWKILAMKANMSVGSWLTEQVNFPPRPGSPGEEVAMLGGWAGIHPDLKHMDETRERMNKEASMDEPVKKAIEPDRVKVGPEGKLRKGLGPLPGEKEARALLEKPDSYHSWSPAPKPGKK